MMFRFLPPSLALALGLVSGIGVEAQGLQLQSSQSLSLPAPVGTRQVDFVVALVNSEPITNSELQGELQRVQQQFALQRRPLPDKNELARQVLERLIGDQIQLQLAKQSGIRIDEAAVDLAEQNVARQNQLSVADMRRQLVAEGVSMPQFRTQLRNQLTLTRLRERELEPRGRVTELEIDQYLREAQSNSGPTTQQINLAQILVVVPDDASDAQVATLRARAEALLARIRAGEDFNNLARTASDAPDRSNGGQLGMRTSDRYPSLFVDATQALALGEVSALVRSGAGFHLLKVMERQDANLPPATVMQTRSRHILLRPGPQLSEAAARDRLLGYRGQIQAGQADFAALARQHSQDSSAAQGGDLGWANPGMFVPEFEQIMNRLAPGQVGEPLVSRFGVHLIEVLERRRVETSQREQREAVRGLLRDKKLEEAYLLWAQDQRSRAYVELRELAP
ncbi:MAG: molecular chaperone SurA [Betaproteobacteria bacterium]|nr:molecular chaperone SurA [Betaproteobacteria bacterium]